jgi:hypothetical protein
MHAIIKFQLKEVIKAIIKVSFILELAFLTIKLLLKVIKLNTFIKDLFYM